MTKASAPAYFMVQIKAKDIQETTERYGQSALATVAAFGGEILCGSHTPKVVEGDWDHNWAAVLRFPTMEMAEAWHNSPEYRPLKDLRINELTDGNRVLLLEGFAPAP